MKRVTVRKWRKPRCTHTYIFKINVRPDKIYKRPDPNMFKGILILL